ncbi:MAG: cytochrome c oxidase subunit II [Acidobacteria bacterium]|nr:cytochrome c oxidase subunit II [Acidobacteriota bacterium]
MPIIPQASSAAGRVDSVFLFILVLCAAVLVFITAALIYFVIRYNRKRHSKGEDIEGNTWLEIFWTAATTVLFLVMFYYGWTNFSYMREAPRDAMQIQVTGRQWTWSFMYPNGKQTADLYLALDRPVKLELRSADVIHGFFVPAFRIKQDVVPGKANYTWFTPTQLGSFDIACTVICGVSHADMLSKAVVVPVGEFEKWYFGDDDTPLPGQAVSSEPVRGSADGGAYEILQDRFCTTCHSIDGTPMVGPTFRGMYGRKQAVTDSDGKERNVDVDEDYLVRAIQDPMAEIMKGYPPAMPKNPLSDEELGLVVEYIKSLK